MSTDGHGTLWHRNIAENFNRLSRVHERYRRQTDDRRQTTDGRTMTYSEHELEFTFAKNSIKSPSLNWPGCLQNFTCALKNELLCWTFCSIWLLLFVTFILFNFYAILTLCLTLNSARYTTLIMLEARSKQGKGNDLHFMVTGDMWLALN